MLPTPTDRRDPYPTKVLMRPAKIFLFILGIYAPGRIRSNACLRIIRQLLMIGLLSLTIFNVVLVARSYYYLRYDFAKASNLLGAVVFHIQQALATYFLMRWVMTKSLKRTLMQLRKANEERGIRAHLHEHKTCLAVVSVFVVVTMIATAVGYISMPQQRADMTMGDPVLDKVYITGLIYGGSCWLLANALFTSTCHYILSEFKYLNDDIAGSTFVNVDRLQNLMRIHLQLSNTLQMANRVFGQYIFSMFAANVPLTVLILYNMCYNTAGGPWIWFLGLLLFMCGMQLAGLTFVPAKIYDEGCRTADLLRLMAGMRDDENVWSDQRVFNMACWFLRQAESASGLSAGGYFVVTKSLALTVASLIITYLTLLIQSGPTFQLHTNGTLIASDNGRSDF